MGSASSSSWSVHFRVFVATLIDVSAGGGPHPRGARIGRPSARHRRPRRRANHRCVNTTPSSLQRLVNRVGAVYQAITPRRRRLSRRAYTRRLPCPWTTSWRSGGAPGNGQLAAFRSASSRRAGRGASGGRGCEPLRVIAGHGLRAFPQDPRK